MALYRAKKTGITEDTTSKKTRSLLSAAGLPSPVLNLSASTISSAQINLSWSVPYFNGDSSITGYTVSTSPSGGSVNISGTSASVTSLNPATTYSFTVRAQNSVGLGAPGQAISASTTAWNDATGGTVTEVTNYNSTGETWRVHNFSSNGTLTVVSSPEVYPFRTLTAGGGGGGGGDGVYHNQGAPGGRGQTVTNDTDSLTAGTYPVVRGGGGGGGAPARDGSPGGSSNINSTRVAGGGGGGGWGDHGSARPANPNYPSVSSDITGTSAVWSGGGGHGSTNHGSPGGAGRVIVAYRIG